MLERELLLKRLGDIREMSSRILEESQDLVEVDDEAINSVLIPRVVVFLEARKSGGWLPPGAELPLASELGLNLFHNVVNYCYRHPETGHEYVYTSQKTKTIKRATGLLTALSEAPIDWNDIARVAKLTPEEWAGITQISEANPMYLGEERRTRITGLATYLVSRGHRNVEEFLNDGCDLDAVKMTGVLAESGFFDDEFMKRNMLAAKMVSGVLSRRTGSPLAGTEHLCVMADYRIPQVFFNLGAVRVVDEELLETLMIERQIEPRSREERALRATCPHIGKIIADALGITEDEVDDALWGLSQEMAKKGEMTVPHMNVATEDY